jgi:hypothetical protein
MTSTNKRLWTKGQSGNPAGRPRGARHRTTVMLEMLMADDAEAIVRAVLTAAANGDMSAARMVLDRIIPPAKERPLSVTLPPIDDMDSLAKAQTAIVAAVSSGELLPSEGQSVSALLESRMRIAEVADLERRLAELEGRQ